MMRTLLLSCREGWVCYLPLSVGEGYAAGAC